MAHPSIQAKTQRLPHAGPAGWLAIWFLAFLLLFACALQARAAELSPSDFLAALRDRAAAQLAETGSSASEREMRFEALLREFFDMEGIARFVAGPTWQDADVAQQQAFAAAFEQSIVRRFLPLLSDNGGRRVDFEPTAQETGSNGMLQVKASVQDGNGQATELVWRLRLTEAGYKILDLSAQGISMAITLRDEYASVLKSNGGDLGDLARMIQKKTASTKG